MDNSADFILVSGRTWLSVYVKSIIVLCRLLKEAWKRINYNIDGVRIPKEKCPWKRNAIYLSIYMRLVEKEESQ